MLININVLERCFWSFAEPIACSRVSIEAQNPFCKRLKFCSLDLTKKLLFAFCLLKACFSFRKLKQKSAFSFFVFFEVAIFRNVFEGPNILANFEDFCLKNINWSSGYFFCLIFALREFCSWQNFSKTIRWFRALSMLNKCFFAI